MKQGKILELQALRGVAAIIVTVYHVLETSMFNQTTSSILLWLRDFFDMYGSIGVPLFFVLSGFIITVSVFFSNKKNIQADDFIIKRFIRVYPVYWVYFFIALLFLMVQAVFSDVGWDGVNIGYILKSFLLLPTFDQYGDFYPLLIVGWSLIFEIYFYGLFFLALSLSLTYKQTFLFISVFMLAGILAPNFLAVANNIDNAFIYLVSHELNICFLVGMILAVAYHKNIFSVLKLQRFIKIALLVSSAFMLVRSVLLSSDDESVFLPCLLSSLLVAYCLLPNLGFRLCYKAMAYMGDMSYTLYLSHTIFIIIITALWKRGVLTFPAVSEIVIVSVISLLLIAIAFCLYKCIEQPLIRYLSNTYVSLKVSKKHNDIQQYNNTDIHQS